MSHEGSDSELTQVWNSNRLSFAGWIWSPKPSAVVRQIRGLKISGALRNTQNAKHEQISSRLRLFSLKC